MSAIITVKNLNYTYENGGQDTPVQKTPVLQDCTFEIREGEFVAIQGPSGSGKSTLLYLLGCMNPVQSGTLKIGGVDIRILSSEETAFFRNKMIGFVFQQFHLLAKTKVSENILLPSLYPVEKKTSHIDFKKKVHELVKNLGLEGREDYLPHQLSGGQQQRVAIARALLNDAPIILADEPTGNLDSKNSASVMQELRRLCDEGKTVIVITHDKDIAQQADRIIYLHDGRVEREETLIRRAETEPAPPVKWRHDTAVLNLSYLAKIFPFASANLFRNKTRSFLTMVGISIGVAAVLAMMTLGQYAKEKILSGYAELGVNTLNFWGEQNWKQKAVDRFGVNFSSFKMEQDILPLKKIFPEVVRISPVMQTWGGALFSYGGKSIDQDGRVVGINEEAFAISGQKIARGSPIDHYHIENQSPVCLIGSEIVERLFINVDPLGEVLKVNDEDRSYGCRVIGIMNSRNTRSQWRKPNLEIYIPYTYFQAVSGNWWSAQIHSLMIQLKSGSPIELTGKAIRAFFERKYGTSGMFRMDADSILIEQMSRFLDIFSAFLGTVALISLGVGGVGIANMMLVSVSERYREIGLRKALGATDKSIRFQFLLEAVLLCGLAGLAGMIFGFACYEIIIWGASKLITSMKFEWVVSWTALFFSALSIFVVGVLSGFAPAIKAEKLSPIEALRSE